MTIDDLLRELESELESSLNPVFRPLVTDGTRVALRKLASKYMKAAQVLALNEAKNKLDKLISDCDNKRSSTNQT